MQKKTTSLSSLYIWFTKMKSYNLFSNTILQSYSPKLRHCDIEISCIAGIPPGLSRPLSYDKRSYCMIPSSPDIISYHPWSTACWTHCGIWWRKKKPRRNASLFNHTWQQQCTGWTGRQMRFWLMSACSRSFHSNILLYNQHPFAGLGKYLSTAIYLRPVSASEACSAHWHDRQSQQERERETFLFLSSSRVQIPQCRIWLRQTLGRWVFFNAGSVSTCLPAVWGI